MREETVLAVIASKGVFQINPLAYRNEKTMKLLKRMVRDGKIKKQKVCTGLYNYFLKDKE